MEKVSDAHVTLGKRIRDQREKAGMTQQRVARDADLDASFFGRVERGESNIGFTKLLRVAEAIDIDPGDLIRGIKSFE